MLPSSHSFSGRWTCRSTARIKLGRERLRAFDDDRVADADRPALNHTRDHAPPALELLLQAIADFIHPETGLADGGDLQNSAPAEAHHGAGRELHNVDAFHRDVLFDRPREDSNRIERFLVGQQDLPLGRGGCVLVALDAKAFDQVRPRNELHRFPVTRTELDGDDAGRHGLQITRGPQDRETPTVIRMTMAATGALGVIKSIQARMDYREMLVYEDFLVVVSSGGMFGRMLATQFGLIGMLIYRLGRKSREAAAKQRRQQSAGQLLALDPKGVQMMTRDIVDARVNSGLLSSKLTLSLADGTSRKYTWAKKENEYAQVVSFLRGALGTKLVDEKA